MILRCITNFRRTGSFLPHSRFQSVESFNAGSKEIKPTEQISKAANIFKYIQKKFTCRRKNLQFSIFDCEKTKFPPKAPVIY